MRSPSKLIALAFAVGMLCAGLLSQPANADVLGNGSALTDTLQIGEITGIGDRQLNIATKFEKDSKNFTLNLLPECYVMTAKRGEFKKFSELKKGDLIAAYGWYKDNKWNARRIDILDRNDYLVKRLDADAKAGAFFKHER